MNRRHFFRGLLVLPLAAIAAPLAALAPKSREEFPEEIRIPVTTSVDRGPSTKIGTITINLRCHTDVMERDLDHLQRAIKNRVRQSRF